jgi:hypothetical protein
MARKAHRRHRHRKGSVLGRPRRQDGRTGRTHPHQHREHHSLTCQVERVVEVGNLDAVLYLSQSRTMLHLVSEMLQSLQGNSSLLEKMR